MAFVKGQNGLLAVNFAGKQQNSGFLHINLELLGRLLYKMRPLVNSVS
jgi:hypothetical protein